MKTKPITLIVSLLFCFTGGVYADSEYNVESYKLLDEFHIMTQKDFKAVVEISDITNELEKLRKDSNNPLQNFNDVENTKMINRFLVGISDVVSGLRLVLTYEKLIVQNKIMNFNVIKKHNALRYLHFKELKYNIELTIKEYAEKNWKKCVVYCKGLRLKRHT